MKNERVKEAQRVTAVCFFVNLFLTAGKILAGIVGNSAAMLADGIHSMSDFITDLIVMVFIKISGKASDERHSYGHGKYETFATLLISVILFLVGLGVLMDSAQKIIYCLKGNILPQPGAIALWAALISIVVKEILYRYTAIVGKRINSPTVIANGWHHRSDAFSSLGTALGISGAIFLGEKWRILDPIAGIIVSFFIIKIAIKLAKPSYEELLECALPEETCQAISHIIESQPEVVNYHNLKTRKIGTNVAIEVHIMMNKDLSFEDSHNVTKRIEILLDEYFEGNIHTSIHAEPEIGRAHV